MSNRARPLPPAPATPATAAIASSTSAKPASTMPASVKPASVKPASAKPASAKPAPAVPAPTVPALPMLRAVPIDPVPSPCVLICHIDEASGFCQGCRRTLDEIACWSRLSDSEKLAVWRQLDQR